MAVGPPLHAALISVGGLGFIAGQIGELAEYRCAAPWKRGACLGVKVLTLYGFIRGEWPKLRSTKPEPPSGAPTQPRRGER
jgi:hypothetical protein